MVNVLKRRFLLILFSAGFLQSLQALIIYRPENSEVINTIRCYIRIMDNEGNETPASETTAWYEWATAPSDRPSKDYHLFQSRYYLEGGVAAHISFKKEGIYRISVFTPVEDQKLSPAKTDCEWTSETFLYDTRSRLKVIFVSPAADDCGFYNGGWHISHRAPAFYKVTKPERLSNYNFKGKI